MLRKITVLLLLLVASASGQRRVDSKNLYHRVICVTPLVGSGTATDPIRPKYAPWPLPVPQVAASKPISRPEPSQNGIIAFSFVPSDDGHFAIVEFVARNRTAFAPVFSDRTIQVFEKGKATRAAIEAVLQKYRKSFYLEQFGTVMP
jgi:hypothetical protein